MTSERNCDEMTILCYLDKLSLKEFVEEIRTGLDTMDETLDETLEIISVSGYGCPFPVNIKLPRGN